MERPCADLLGVSRLPWLVGILALKMLLGEAAWGSGWSCGGILRLFPLLVGDAMLAGSSVL